MNRRAFVSLVGGAVLSPLFGPLSAARAADEPRRLVVVMLRGAVDGLNVVVPYGEQAYYEAPPGHRDPEAGRRERRVAARRAFRAAPVAGAALMPLWTEKKLAFIHAVFRLARSEPFAFSTRSNSSRTARPAAHVTQDGWMNRTLAALPGTRGPTDALSIGPTLPFILRGPAAVANLPLGPNAAQPMAIDRPDGGERVRQALCRRRQAKPEAYRQGREARTQLVADMSGEQQMADNGAPPANTLPATAGRLAGLLTKDRHIRLAFASLGGWDTHVNQGSP